MKGVAKAKHIVEAALFTAGRPITPEEIASATGLEREIVVRAIEELMSDYSSRETSLEIVKAGRKYAMQVSGRYAQYTMKLAEIEIPRGAIKTLALIAYHQPVRQSDLKMMIGSKVYDHVHLLTSMGLVRARPEGRTVILTTTSRFPEYFGIETADRKKIKRFLAEKVGIIRKEESDAGNDV